MDDLKTMMDSLSIKDINENVRQFIHSADGYSNRLKLTFALLGLIDESCTLLRTVDLNDFISDIRKRINDIDSQSGNLKEVYRRHLCSNKDISSILADPGNNKVATLQKDIEKFLGDYDGILKELLEQREKLPIETQLKEQEQR